MEYNADTPTALIEAAVVQWYWLQELFPHADQFNSIHDRLIDAWRNVAAERVHFAAVRDLPEDTQTLTYLMDTCQQAGFSTQGIAIGALGCGRSAARFVDADGAAINALFKLYPWEWMWHEPFVEFLPTGQNLFVERGMTVEENGGDYGEEGFVYQALAPIPNFGGNRPVCGVWVVNHAACGLGVREDTRRITGNLSRFVPHRMG